MLVVIVSTLPSFSLVLLATAGAEAAGVGLAGGQGVSSSSRSGLGGLKRSLSSGYSRRRSRGGDGTCIRRSSSLCSLRADTPLNPKPLKRCSQQQVSAFVVVLLFRPSLNPLTFNMSQLATICQKTQESPLFTPPAASALIMMRAATLPAWTTKVKNTFLEFDEEGEPRYRRSSSAPPHMLRIAPEDQPVQSRIAPEDPPVQSQIVPEDPPFQSQIAPEDPPVQSQLNPDAPEFDFTEVSGETQFGSESYVYLPLPESPCRSGLTISTTCRQTGFC